MNGRIYDPLIGRFLSADIAVQFPTNLQSYNRYSYVLNNPLTFDDPSGYYLDLLIEVVSLSVGTWETGKAIVKGDWKGAGIAAGGVGADIVLAFVPGVPGATSLSLKATREASERLVKEGAEIGSERLAKETGEKLVDSTPAGKALDSNAPQPKLKDDLDPNTGASLDVEPRQVASPYPEGRQVSGNREGIRPTDPPAGMRESGAWEMTPENLARMERGQPPLGRDGNPVQLHHRGQNPDGPLDEMSATTHRSVEHPNQPSQINRNQFAGERRRYWVERARELLEQE